MHHLKPHNTITHPLQHTTWSHNIFFNVPRAGININDAFGGGNYIDHSLMFNTVRETADHGPLNTWDRMPFITLYDEGAPSTKPQESCAEIGPIYVVGKSPRISSLRIITQCGLSITTMAAATTTIMTTF